MNLQPGDMCVVLDDGWIPLAAKFVVGRTVILIEIARPSSHLLNPKLEPYWICAGVPNNWAVSHTILRKIPPAPMEETHEEQETLNV